MNTYDFIRMVGQLGTLTRAQSEAIWLLVDELESLEAELESALSRNTKLEAELDTIRNRADQEGLELADWFAARRAQGND